jgi:predicted molibdopterin-dependent oxidoreductase YjgC
VVQTESPKLARYRRSILQLLLSNYYDASYTRSNGAAGLSLDTQFAHWLQHYEIDIQAGMIKEPKYPVDSDPNPFVWVDMNKCILCTRCVRACAEVQGRFVWGLAYRGFTSQIVAGADTTMLQARCESCGACVAYCPTGALDNKMSVSLGKPNRLVTTTCSYCAVGCQFDLNIKDDVPGSRVLRVTSNPHAPINGMHLCVKGRYGYDFIHSAGRLIRPKVRKYLLEGAPRPKFRGQWVEVDWDTALNIAANGLRAARDQNGAESVGVLTSGRSTNEENYLMNKLARQVLGTNNIDCCSHLYHASTVEGLADALGIGAQTNSIDDVVEHANALLIIGSNITEQHPVLGARIRQAVMRRGCKLVVAHPDFINISEYAALRLVHKFGTDAVLVNGLMHIILEKGWEDKKFIQQCTTGFEDLKRSLQEFSPQRVAQLTGVTEEALFNAAEILASQRPMAVIWAVDLAQPASAWDNVTSLTNLQMLLGNLGVPGGGLISLRSQNNSQGACDMGGLPEFYPGYQPAGDENVRLKFENAWGTRQPGKAGMKAVEMISAAYKGNLKALYILGEDLVANAMNSPQVRRGLEACNFVVLQEIFSSETSRYADVLLPGASFAEKSGTFTNTERRVQMVHQAIQPPEEAREDWKILVDVAKRILAGDKVASCRYAGWDYSNPAQIMMEVAALTPIYTGVSHERLEKGVRLQWPLPELEHPGTPMLYGEQFFGEPVKFLPVHTSSTLTSGSTPEELSPRAELSII